MVSRSLVRERRAFRGRRHDLVREPDAGDLHIRFDERRLETEPWRGVRHRHCESRREQLPPSAYRYRASCRLYSNDCHGPASTDLAPAFSPIPLLELPRSVPLRVRVRTCSMRCDPQFLVLSKHGNDGKFLADVRCTGNRCKQSQDTSIAGGSGTPSPTSPHRRLGGHSDDKCYPV